jgi:alpha-1,6-mannosyltransferase
VKAFSSKYTLVALVLVSALAYARLGYHMQRADFVMLVTIFAISFSSTVLMLRCDVSESTLYKIGIFFRAVLIFATPVLSQDFYRFIWDGHISLLGFNPYLFRPDEIIQNVTTLPNAAFLHQKMGSLSAGHFSNYPPLNQFFFLIAAFIGGKSILLSTIALRITIILADIGIYHYGRKILTYLKINTKNIFWYFLNPLVITELTGNLHFEGVMLFFFIAGIYFLIKNQILLVGLLIGLSISTKLLPLLLLPLFFQYLGLRRSIIFYAIIGGINVLLFLPFISEALLDNYTKTIALWFTNFEFNASMYYLIRDLGFQTLGYNIIQIFGRITPWITILMVLYFSLVKKNHTIASLLRYSLLVLTMYFFISTTIHPWYIINVVLLSIFTTYRFPIFWSFLIILSYSAYSMSPVKENMSWIALEYVVVYMVFVYEVFLNSFDSGDSLVPDN